MKRPQNVNFAEEKEKTQAREKKDQQWWLILYTFQDRDGFMPAHQYNQHSTQSIAVLHLHVTLRKKEGMRSEG